MKILNYILENEECSAPDIKEALGLNESQYKELYRKTDSWSRKGLIEKIETKKKGSRGSRIIFKATKGLREYFDEVEKLRKGH